ncbi:unnamed protein product [Periconia digitata]|uniref:Uncharacterized protein n=1 Tax=Periconia digitata TaxID=1303443 RepID=A0A9W4XQX2_9PLEO|nr:unnamed protein product [Periconia digitata]
MASLPWVGGCPSDACLMFDLIRWTVAFILAMPSSLIDRVHILPLQSSSIVNHACMHAFSTPIQALSPFSDFFPCAL